MSFLNFNKNSSILKIEYKKNNEYKGNSNNYKIVEYILDIINYLYYLNNDSYLPDDIMFNYHNGIKIKINYINLTDKYNKDGDFIIHIKTNNENIKFNIFEYSHAYCIFYNGDTLDFSCSYDEEVIIFPKELLLQSQIDPIIDTNNRINYCTYLFQCDYTNKDNILENIIKCHNYIY